MADKNKAVPENVAGDFFVDSTCINCDTCRQLAPEAFKDAGPHSYVFQQPRNDMESRQATRALLCCPTGSIGTRGKNAAREVMQDFPLRLADDVYYCGFNSEDSYGANSFLIVHKDGNWLIDSPKFLPHLTKRIEELGGLKYVFLTHRDDVADAGKFAQRFAAMRIIHKDDASAEPDAEIVIEGKEECKVGDDFVIIPVPGHTLGHCCLLYKKTYLFTGDHLYFDSDDERLGAFRRHCWYSWTEQIHSMERLLHYDFEWVLAGHGNRVHLPQSEMKRQLTNLVQWMKTVP